MKTDGRKKIRVSLVNLSETLLERLAERVEYAMLDELDESMYVVVHTRLNDRLHDVVLANLKNQINTKNGKR